MSQPVVFEDLEQGGPVETYKPFFAIDFQDEDAILTWLKDNLNMLKSNSWQRLEKIKNNYFRYKGIQYMNQVYMPRDIPETRKRYMPQIVIPMIRDSVDEKVARIMESKPTVVVLPTDDEERDKVDAKIAKRFLSHIDYQEKMQDKLRSWLKNAEIAGESYLLPRWNPDKGDEIPEVQMLKEQAAQNPGAPAPKIPSIKLGDVEIKIFTPHHLLHEEHPSKDWNEVNYCFIIEYEYTDGLKKEYPDKESDIASEPVGSVYFDFEALEEKPLQGFTRKVTFFHRRMKYLPNGYECVFVNGAILKKGPLGEEFVGDKLPVERLIVGKNEEELHGESPIESVRGIASQVNNAQNLIIKQLMLTAHPKWFVEEGSVDDQQLNNDTGIVKIKRGSQKPVLAQANPVSPQLIDHVDRLEKKFYDYAKSNSIVRGEPPAGVDAFVALQYISEAESRRLSTEVSYFSEGVVNIYQRILKLCGKKYKAGEKRTMMIQGKDNRFNMLKYDPESLQKDFSVIIQNTSGLPDSKAGRIQAILDTEARFPGMLPREQVIELMGFGQSDKYIDVAGSAARAAEEENELMLDGKGMVEPAPYEDLVVHWKIHAAAIQDVAFKTKVDPKIQAAAIDHLRATEMLMIQRSQKSPAFIQVLMSIPQFPMIFEPMQSFMPPPPPPMPGDMGAAPQDNMPKPKNEKNPNVDMTMAGTPRMVPPSPPPKVPQPL